MFYYIFYRQLQDSVSGFRLFRFITFRMAGAAITAFLLGIIFGPMLIRLFRRMKVLEKTEKKDAEKLAEMHGVKKNTPTMGGVIVVLSVVVTTVLWGNFNDPVNLYLSLGLVVMLVLGGVGFVDDYIKLTRIRSAGLTKRQKSLMQGVLALAVGVALYYAFAQTTIGSENYQVLKNLYNGRMPATVEGYGSIVTRFHLPFVSNPMYYIPLTVIPFAIIASLVMVGTSNAVNLTDGLDGLAMSLALIVVGVFTVLSYVVGHVLISRYLRLTYIPGVGELAVMGSALLGAGLAFLWFNCHPAEVFMGDTGSLSLGGVIGYMAVVTRNELLLFLVGGVFVAETVSVMLQVFYFKKTKGKRLFLCAPLHHHYEYKGWPESKVTFRFIIIGIVLALASLATLKVR